MKEIDDVIDRAKTTVDTMLSDAQRRIDGLYLHAGKEISKRMDEAALTADTVVSNARRMAARTGRNVGAVAFVIGLSMGVLAGLASEHVACHVMAAR